MNQTKNTPPPALVLRRLIHAKREKVFEAWSKPEMMNKWFFAGNGSTTVTNSFRVGGAYKNRMMVDTGSPCSDGSSELQEKIHHGEYLEIAPPEKIVFTWNSHIVTNSRVTIELRERGDDTELILTHELLETADLRQMHEGGWSGCLNNLENFFKS